eukprot:2309631-Amphidinium_carterae.1
MLIPKDVFLDMLTGLLGLRGMRDRLSWEEQLAASCSVDEADMVDVRGFIASLPPHEAAMVDVRYFAASPDLPQAEAEESHEVVQAMREEDGKGSGRGGGRSRMT